MHIPFIETTTTTAETTTSTEGWPSPSATEIVVPSNSEEHFHNDINDYTMHQGFSVSKRFVATHLQTYIAFTIFEKYSYLVINKNSVPFIITL